MRIILAGGTGLLGRRLAAALAGSGASVAVLSREPGRSRLPAGIETHPWSELADVIEGASAVVNLAGEGIADQRWTAARKQVLRDSRTAPTARIVAALAGARRRPEVLVNASAIGYYGDRPEAPCDEGSPPGLGFFPELCSAWERAAEPAMEVGVRVVKLRTGVVLDREGGALPRMALPVRFLAGATVGTGEQGLSWIHHQDLVALTLAVLVDPWFSGPVNATAPAPVSQRDFLRELGRRLHRPVFSPPAVLTRAAVRLLLGEMAEAMLLEGARVLPGKALERGFEFRFPTLPGALADLFP